MSKHELIIEGARQNNLKNISLSLPHNKVIAVTGVSGSGKSSLAFDTIFAEGQWRFLESLSTYARLFIEKLDRPELDAIYNVRPAIALEQKNPVRGARSTVGTLTEIYDLLRVIYSKVAVPYCPVCSREIRKWDPSEIVSELLQHHEGKRAAVVFLTDEDVGSLKRRGFLRLWVNGDFMDISETDQPQAGSGPNASAVTAHPKEVVLDRLAIRDEPRLSDSIENAWKEGRESLRIILFGDTGERPVLKFSSLNSCDDCGISLPEPSPIMFSFNHPVCACPECKGFGNVLVYDEDLLVPDKDLSVSEGALELWEKPGYIWWKEQLVKGLKKSGFNLNKPFSELCPEEKDLLYKGDANFYGINNFFEEMENKRYKLHIRVMLSRYRSPVTCPACGGKRLQQDALAYKIESLDIAEISELTVSELLKLLSSAELSPMLRDIAKEALSRITLKLRFLQRVGLEYLTLSRQSRTLSGGEYQRVNLSNQLGSALTGTIYVLDEPTIGLHPRDTRRIAEIMRDLSNLGNTIIVVEHDRDIISSCDWVLELGPGGGQFGGEVVFSGPMKEFLEADTLTAQYLRHSPATVTTSKRKPVVEIPGQPSLILRGASGHNLRHVDLHILLNKLTIVSGVSGSGKSSLVVETLYPMVARHFKMDAPPPLPCSGLEGITALKGIRLIDQGPIGKTPRSNPLTYLKAFEPIRKLFASLHEAKAHGYRPGFFSFNVPGGRCEACKGEGFQRMEMYFFEDIYARCEECWGKRYGADALRISYRGKNISEVLDLTVEEAFEFFSDISELSAKLKLMMEIGLGYLRLGQSATTLSGGEAQRLKICAELSGPRSSATDGLLYILDEPTVGLHGRDVAMLMSIIGKLVGAGNTVVMIEHNVDVIAGADWVIDLGPEGGAQGGEIIFEGTPEALRKAKHSYTGRYL
jgi:excinuclease ABC subunit A